ncbi:MAG: NTP transferase domain-containing protein [Candidatus Marinimicrobia bacterium]|nr:NTP transferase domain-containing protein [Candidatus Neomarinimicrobiota bacterium]
MLLNQKQPLTTVIMAAGKGTRMKSDLPKVLHLVDDKPMLLHVIDLARQLNSERIINILGYQKDLVIEVIASENVEYVIQEPQLGTGHAVQQTETLLKDFDGDVLVLSGDVPLLRKSTIDKMLRIHREAENGATVLTAIFENPHGYGRVIRKNNDTLAYIIEEKDCNDKQREIKEINSGIYIFKSKELFPALNKIKNDNRQNEYYLPDALKYIAKAQQSIALHITGEPIEISGVNTVEQLRELNLIFKKWYG